MVFQQHNTGTENELSICRLGRPVQMVAEQVSLLQQVDLVSLRDFVTRRFKEDGGFAATPMLVHTLFDTYYAIEILAIVQKLLNDGCAESFLVHEATQAYLVGFARQKNTIPARIKCQLTALLHRFSLPVKQLPPVESACRRFRSFEEQFYLTSLGEETPFVAEHDFFLSLPLKTVRECSFYLQWRQIGYPEAIPGVRERNRIAGWLRASQNLDGGFGFYPGTTSYLENSFFALHALKEVKTFPADVRRAVNYILLCQAGTGGFSRSPAAAPFLEDSLYALRALAALSGL